MQQRCLDHSLDGRAIPGRHIKRLAPKYCPDADVAAMLAYQRGWLGMWCADDQL
jgi:hypothetical protein